MTAPQLDHRGVAENDPRNAGVIAFFQPQPVTRASVQRRFTDLYRDETPDQIAARADAFMAPLRTKTVRPPPGLSQNIDEIADPFYTLSAHPDLVSRLWSLDRTLPQSCRWVVWGRPALVHPKSGVVFAVAIGTLGVAARLPPDLREGAPTDRPLRPPRVYDLSPAGPEWRFLPSQDEAATIRAAYEDAA